MNDALSKMRQAGERQLISVIQHLQANPPIGYVGIGDDAAFLPAGPQGWVVTSDMLVEGVHFRWDWIDAEQLGEKAVAVSVSDVAAMGAIPRAALTSLALPAGFDLEAVEALYRGIARGLDRYGAVLVGGDTVRSASGWVLDVTVLGEPGANGIALRKGAMPGDALVVTGRLGAARAGLVLLERGVRWPGQRASERSLLTAHLRPQARVEAGLVLAEIVHALTDVSDGLLAELFELVVKPGFGARIIESNLPIDRATRDLAAAIGEDPTVWAYTGGEDYELLAAVPPGRIDELREAMKPLHVPVTVIGEVQEQPGIVAVRRGETVALGEGGFDHFRA